MLMMMGNSATHRCVLAVAGRDTSHFTSQIRSNKSTKLMRLTFFSNKSYSYSHSNFSVVFCSLHLLYDSISLGFSFVLYTTRCSDNSNRFQLPHFTRSFMEKEKKIYNML